MNAVRMIYKTPPETIRLPDEFRHGSVEVIIIPIESPAEKQPNSQTSISSSWLAELSGSWQGSSLVRDSQGEYEAREELR